MHASHPAGEFRHTGERNDDAEYDGEGAAGDPNVSECSYQASRRAGNAEACDRGDRGRSDTHECDDSPKNHRHDVTLSPPVLIRRAYGFPVNAARPCSKSGAVRFNISYR